MAVVGADVEGVDALAVFLVHICLWIREKKLDDLHVAAGAGEHEWSDAVHGDPEVDIQVVWALGDRRSRISAC